MSFTIWGVAGSAAAAAAAAAERHNSTVKACGLPGDKAWLNRRYTHVPRAMDAHRTATSQQWGETAGKRALRSAYDNDKGARHRSTTQGGRHGSVHCSAVATVCGLVLCAVALGYLLVSTTWQSTSFLSGGGAITAAPLPAYHSQVLLQRVEALQAKVGDLAAVIDKLMLERAESRAADETQRLHRRIEAVALALVGAVPLQ